MMENFLIHVRLIWQSYDKGFSHPTKTDLIHRFLTRVEESKILIEHAKMQVSISPGLFGAPCGTCLIKFKLYVRAFSFDAPLPPRDGLRL